MEHYRYMFASGRSDFSSFSGHQKDYELTDRRTQAHRIYRINSPHVLNSVLQLHSTRANPTSRIHPQVSQAMESKVLVSQEDGGGSVLFVEMHISPGGTAKFGQLFNDVWGEGVLL